MKPNEKIYFTFFLLLMLLNSTFTFARVHDYETTRLKSTAGAGVGSVLLDEGAILNPAPVAFFQHGSLYYQKLQGNYEDLENSNNSLENNAQAFIISDAKGRVKGNLSYTVQDEGLDRRKRISASVAHPVGEKSSMGVSYRRTTDENHVHGQHDRQEEKYDQMVIGVFHALNEQFTFGAIVIDPMKKRPEDNKAILGFQYLYKDFIALLVDVGSDYNEPLSENLMYKAALQFKFFEGFYARAGFFNDKSLQEKGDGVGLSWVSPKMLIEAALKNTKPIEATTNNIAYGRKVRETSLSLSLKF